MKNLGKKFLGLVLVSILCLLLVACSSQDKPEDVLDKFLTSIYRGNPDLSEKYLANQYLEELYDKTEIEEILDQFDWNLSKEQMLDYLEAVAVALDQTRWNLGDFKGDENQGVIPIDLKIVNLNALLVQVMAQLDLAGYDQLLGIKPEQVQALPDVVFGVLSQSPLALWEQSFEVPMIKKDGNWQINDDWNFYNSLTGNLLTDLAAAGVITQPK